MSELIYDAPLHYFKCCVCNHEMKLRESIAMQLGCGTGMGACLKCKMLLSFRLTKSGKIRVKLFNPHKKDNTNEQ